MRLLTAADPRSRLAHAMVFTILATFSVRSGFADDYPGLHNVNRATETMIVGSEPEGEVAFQKLKELGVKTIVSVDGAKPNVELARKYGLRYVHIPIGYDGIEKESALAMTRVARESQGLTYVHCHHGKHRGPAAAAIICLAAGTISKPEAVDLMKRAGTGKDYVGLWRDVEAFQPPSKDEKLPELKESAEVESLAAAMAKLDRHFEQVKLLAKSDWKAPKEHPDLDAAAEAILVEEGLKESLRQSKAGADAKMVELLSQSVTTAGQLREALQKKDGPLASRHLEVLTQSCTRCHTEFRN